MSVKHITSTSSFVRPHKVHTYLHYAIIHTRGLEPTLLDIKSELYGISSLATSSIPPPTPHSCQSSDDVTPPIASHPQSPRHLNRHFPGNILVKFTQKYVCRPLPRCDFAKCAALRRPPTGPQFRDGASAEARVQ